jgi:hypothetical protein
MFGLAAMGNAVGTAAGDVAAVAALLALNPRPMLGPSPASSPSSPPRRANHPNGHQPPHGAGRRILEDARGELELHDVTFRYNTDPAARTPEPGGARRWPARKRLGGDEEDGEEEEEACRSSPPPVLRGASLRFAAGRVTAQALHRVGPF